MAAYRRVYDSHHLQADCQVPGSAPGPYAQQGTLKTRDWKTQDWNTRDQIAGVENAGLENAGTSCVWVAKCNIINVPGHVRVNVTVGRGDPCTLQEAIQSGN